MIRLQSKRRASMKESDALIQQSPVSIRSERRVYMHLCESGGRGRSGVQFLYTTGWNDPSFLQ